MKIRPLGERVLVEPLPRPNVVQGGIVIPEMSVEKSSEARVEAVGPGVTSLKRGDRVLMPKYGGSELKIGAKLFQLIQESDILGIIE